MNEQQLQSVIEKINKNEIVELSFLGHAAIRLPELIAIADALKNNSSVLSIDLGGNLIGDAGAEALACVLMRPDCSVQTLDLKANRIGDTGAVAIAEALRRPDCSVQTLDLENNQIGAAGAAALAETLKTNRSVRTLDLSSNLIGAACAAALAEIEKEIEVNRFLNARDALPILDATTRVNGH